MLEGYSKHFATNSRSFPNISEDFRRLPMISEDFIKKFKMLVGRLEHFATFSDFSKDFRDCEDFGDFRILPKISEDFQKLRKVVGMFVFALSGDFA